MIGLILILAAFAVDDAVTFPLQLHSKGWAHSVAAALSKYGDWPPLLLVGLVIAAILFLKKRFEASRLVVVVLIAGMITGFSSTIIRTATGRTRPSTTNVPQGFYGFQLSPKKWHDYGSFPSGHTATTAGLAVAAWMVRRRYGIAFTILMLAVGWSRIALSCHHFSDVIASIAWAIFCAPILFHFFDQRLRQQPFWKNRIEQPPLP